MKILKWLINSTLQTSAGNAVLALVVFVGIGVASAAQTTSWDVTNNPQMFLESSITTTQTANVRLSALVRNGETVTFPTTSGGVLRFRQGSKVEDVSYTSASVNATTKIVTLSGVTRNVCWNQAYTLVSCGNGQSFGKGTIVELSQDARLFNFKANKDRANTFSGSGAIKFSGSGSFAPPVFATTAARDQQMGAAGNEIRLACVQATSACYLRLGGTWTQIGDTGTENATETVAGKVQFATIAELINGTNTGSTLARLVPQLKHFTFTGGLASYFGRIPLLGSDGKLATSMYDRGQEIFLFPQDGTAIGPSTGLAGGIAYQSGTSGTSTDNGTVTVALNSGTGANRMIFVGAQVYTTGDVITGITYGGVAMTRIAYTDEPAGRETVFYVLKNPLPGSNNIVITRTGTTQTDYVAVVYSGVNQDVNFDGTAKVGSGNTIVANPTKTRANSWLIIHGQTNGGTITAGVSATLTVNGTSQVIADNQGISTGTSATLSAGSAINYQAVWISPGSPLSNTFDYDTTNKEYVDFKTVLPSNYAGGTMTATVYWTAARGGNGRSVVWEVKGAVLNNNRFLNPAFGSGETVTDAHQTGSLLSTDSTGAITLSGSTLSAGNPVIFRVSRIPGDASDTMPIDAKLLGIKLSF